MNRATRQGVVSSEIDKIMMARFYGGRGSVELLYGFILIIGFMWCREILGRLSEDLNTFQQGADRSEKLITLIYWFVTVVVMGLMAYSAWALTIKLLTL